MDLIHTNRATPPAGHYSQAVRANGFIFVSGQLGFLPPAAPGARPALADGAAAQTREALRSVRAILEAAGASLAAVASVTVYIPDVALWDEVNQVYEECFGAHRPARAIVPTRELHYGAQVEISVVAVA
ncbi:MULTISPECIES: RidA family protein [Achromobacter]|jgi:2-iminobutanoate/2-iminopropanoate deaminase|uniref:Enamine/imine deaminase n=1 Tax=Achromobacter aegrifaciens TaxID=1287736 RepID=A0AAD2J1K3_ACHAE|nr:MULTISPECIES: Rid family hydrolase [Achromobacter]MBD9380963.1 RidA family protein [Achromobacter sp. ACM02]MBD9419302.1 RidA family protein [Achromobacter sp. ACM04]MBD9429693.1 RidA family protein [Achromobacter sp. ACM03]MBD9475938.1 RidA family protein [Achromobacter sp. ACM01]MDQ1762589.1 Rid family hydrolase [Achromobacter aegrifaciens]